MQDSEDRPRRRSPLVARELVRLDIDIAALSEVPFAGQSSLMKDEVCYIPSSGLGRTQTSAAYLVWASLSKLPLPEKKL